MASKFEWRDEYNIGVEQLDQEHRQLFRIINRLFSFRAEKKDSQWTCKEGIKYFKGHALKHFADEEAYMASIGYEGMKRHQWIHRDFRDNILPALEQELEQTGYSEEAVDHFLGVCAGWLTGHTLTEDQAITKETHTSKWEGLLPGEGREAMKKVIVQLVFDLFGLESQAISEAYGGEKFGKGVYYRLTYGTSQDARQYEVLLVFEEKLLINTVGKIMGLKTNKLDTMLLNATRYTARQFVRRVMEHFPSELSYELKEENLLSYEQFREVFQREQPQVSLLFDAGGAGYFSYCVIAPHLLETGVGTPIEAENALAEVEKYLLSREAPPKPKILIVDDSMTIRKSISDLLGEDYDVSPVDSGLAAIRSITLNRPDLVLLDYEMPVCDGRQTLEMLRSDPGFADLPVIFLTGRDDPESVRKVMALNPAGYLLKYLKPAEIKGKIDGFFQKRRAPGQA